jgi:hypothetical protein
VTKPRKRDLRMEQRESGFQERTVSLTDIAWAIAAAQTCAIREHPRRGTRESPALPRRHAKGLDALDRHGLGDWSVAARPRARGIVRLVGGRSLGRARLEDPGAARELVRLRARRGQSERRRGARGRERRRLPARARDDRDDEVLRARHDRRAARGRGADRRHGPRGARRAIAPDPAPLPGAPRRHPRSGAHRQPHRRPHRRPPTTPPRSAGARTGAATRSRRGRRTSPVAAGGSGAHHPQPRAGRLPARAVPRAAAPGVRVAGGIRLQAHLEPARPDPQAPEPQIRRAPGRRDRRAAARRLGPAVSLRERVLQRRARRRHPDQPATGSDAPLVRATRGSARHELRGALPRKPRWTVGRAGASHRRRARPAPGNRRLPGAPRGRWPPSAPTGS